MPTRHTTKDWQMRQRLAQEAARILIESGSRDYHYAKQKAAEHLAAMDTRNLPSNVEIEEALQEQLRLFHAQSQPQQLQRLRQMAIEAMQFFAEFQPRLVGPVLAGTADEHTPVTLHLFTDSAESVDMYLLNHRIPYEVMQKRVRWRNNEYEQITAFSFFREQVRIEALIFPLRKRQPPLSPIDNQPMQRADVQQVKQLLDEH